MAPAPVKVNSFHMGTGGLPEGRVCLFAWLVWGMLMWLPTAACVYFTFLFLPLISCWIPAVLAAAFGSFEYIEVEEMSKKKKNQQSATNMGVLVSRHMMSGLTLALDQHFYKLMRAKVH